jgi:hypothetical protein
MDVNWNEAEQEWHRLVREQAADAPTEFDLPKQSNPYDLPGCVCIVFALSWFGLSISTGDWKLIVAAIGTMTSLWCIGHKETAIERAKRENTERPPDDRPAGGDEDRA